MLGYIIPFTEQAQEETQRRLSKSKRGIQGGKEKRKTIVNLFKMYYVRKKIEKVIQD